MNGLDGFAGFLVGQFAETPLPAAFVRLFGYTLPIFELVVGVLLVLGVMTRGALIACGLLMTSLVFGSSLRSDWDTVFLQMLYALIFYVLLARRRDDALTAGELFGSRGGRA